MVVKAHARIDNMNKGPLIAESERFGTHFASYATATCDGILTLLAIGVSPNDERTVSALSWLQDHEGFGWPAGIPAADPTGWGGAMYYYHMAVRAEAYAALGVAGEWTEHLTSILSKEQHPDGHFLNPSGSLNKEDDPLIATTLALEALLSAATPAG